MVFGVLKEREGGREEWKNTGLGLCKRKNGIVICCFRKIGRNRSGDESEKREFN